MLEALCEALQHAHNYQNEEGKPEPVYHRNISLQTVFLVRDSRSGRNVIKLADFDFAKFGKHTINPIHLGPDYRDKIWPQTAFTAPEVLKDPSNARRYSDIYALGVLWYFLALLPHYDPTIQFNPLTDAGKIDILPLPGEAQTLLKHMLAYDKSQRPQHIEEVIEVIKFLSSSTPSSSLS
jgi:serine/threonine protein kinase